MEPVVPPGAARTRGLGVGEAAGRGRRPQSRNKQWVAMESGVRNGSSARADGERWERGGHRGGRGSRGILRGGERLFPNASLRMAHAPSNTFAAMTGDREDRGDEEGEDEELEDQDPDTPEEREKFYQELVKAREIERKKAIAEGKMDDPLVPKRLEDAITMVGTCMDMCPRFERYRRERENNLFEWEMIPGTKRVDHKRAVKMYERAAGDKTIPSDLRPPVVLQRTLNYLFHDLLPRGGFSQTFNFIRDRSRAVRNDFTMQHNTGPIAIECHDRCARFHILALHFERDTTGFSIALEEQQLMNTLQSLKEFYEDQRGRYESPTELEMRVYHRLIHIRDQKERHEDIPEHITSHPVFKLTTDFRIHVQRQSAPISKTSPLIVNTEGMQIFGELASVLRQQGNVVMISLVACLLERLFGKDTIDDIEAIRGDLEIPDIIDGAFVDGDDTGSAGDFSGDHDEEMLDELDTQPPVESENVTATLPPFKPNEAQSFQTAFAPATTTSATSGPPAVAAVSSAKPVSAFSTLATTPNVFNSSSIFSSTPPNPPTSVFGVNSSGPAFGRLEATSAVTSNSSSTPLFQLSGSNSLSSSDSNPFAPKTLTGTASAAAGSSSVMALNLTPGFPPAGSAFRAPSLPNEASKPPAPSLTSTLPFGGQESTLSKPTVDNAPIPRDVAPVGEAASIPLFLGSTPSRLNSQAPVFTPLVTPPSSSAPLFNDTSKSDPATPGLQPPTQVTNAFPPPTTASSSLPSTPAPTVENAAQSKSQPLPALHRTSTTPPLPKINTNTSTHSTSIGPRQGLYSSPPTEPPLLPRRPPISLPSTPTTQPHNPLLDAFKNNLDKPRTYSSSGILSPLYLPSPTTSGPSTVHNFSPNGIPKTLELTSSPKSPVKASNGKGKAKATYPDVKKSLEINRDDDTFSQQSTDENAWIQACNQSDAYRKKIRGQELSSGASFKKRRISTGPNVTPESSEKKRIRRRVDRDYQPPRTDEALVQRLKENQEEHERRWAQGSFLQVIRTHVKSRTNGTSLPHDWGIWLSMNADNDATAIWLERKFNVPASGRWKSDTIFAIPLSPNNASFGSPGLILFECTPLEDVADDLERKYRILDDCARLRDVIQALPPKRHFIPCLLVFYWEGGKPSDLSSDLLDMIVKLTGEHVLRSHHIFSISSRTTDLDAKLSEALGFLTLDVEGKLVRTLTLRGVFKLFEPSFNLFASEWIENCSADGYFDWNLYGQVAQASLNLLNKLAQHTCRLMATRLDSEPLRGLKVHDISDSESMYDNVMLWLAENPSAAARNVAADLQSHRNLGRDFPSKTFLDHLHDLAQYQTGVDIKSGPDTKFDVPTVDIASELEQFQNAIRSQTVKLGQALHFSLRRSPRRRSVSEDTDHLSSISSKRRRLSSPEHSIMSDEGLTPSPQVNNHIPSSPSNSTVSLAQPEAPLVTVAMLRALTKDLKQKYGKTV